MYSKLPPEDEYLIYSKHAEDIFWSKLRKKVHLVGSYHANLLLLLLLYEKNRKKKAVSLVVHFGIDFGEITKIRCEVSVNTPLGTKTVMLACRLSR